MRESMVIQLQRPEAQTRAETRPRREFMVYALGALLALILIALVFVAGAWLVSRGLSASPEIDAEEVVNNVGLLMLLPSDEQPTIATVTNLDSLAGQAFFRNASVGDVVLMYPKSQRAILYSPSENMIVEVAPIVLGAQ